MELGSAAIAVAITLYFWRVNTRGIHESSDKALKIMGATTVMAVVMIVWCVVTLAVHPEKAELPTAIARPLAGPTSRARPRSTLEGKPIPDAMGQPLDPLGFLGRTHAGRAAPAGTHQLVSLIGVLGIFVAFGHSILAMSGEETLAQVYREVESPKLQNFKKAAFVVFVYSLLLTSLISFLAVMIIPDERADGQVQRQPDRRPGDERGRPLLGPARAERAGGRGRLPDPLGRGQHVDHRVERRAEPRGRGRRDARLVPQAAPEVRHDATGWSTWWSSCRLFTIVASRGKVLVLGEAYAFGVVWSFVFNALSMLVLRFKRPGHREYEVPLNVKVRGYDVPIGIA